MVVDQSRNIGALALARAKAAGMSAAHLPGLAAQGRQLFAGDAKTDERDAMVIANGAGHPDALLPVGDRA
ncbi:MAG: IS110 family transposase [Collinsella sp.]